MSYGSILVHLEFDGYSSARLQYATDMAGDLDAYLIGFSAAAIRPARERLMGVAIDGAPIEDAGARAEVRFGELRRHFFETAGDGHNSAWRQAEDLPTAALIANATVADLIVSGTPTGATVSDPRSDVDPGRLVCEAGRPVLLVGEGAVFRHPRCAVVGWKARPQARRALIFALPFLKLAKRTLVLTVAEDGDTAPGLDDAVRYLMRHDIDAESQVVAAGNGAEAFLDAVRSAAADLVVAGACGHSLLGERLFGGFTQALLMQSDLTRLMAG